jgi:hypothetical protein
MVEHSLVFSSAAQAITDLRKVINEDKLRGSLVRENCKNYPCKQKDEFLSR